MLLPVSLSVGAAVGVVDAVVACDAVLLLLRLVKLCLLLLVLFLLMTLSRQTLTQAHIATDVATP